MDIFVTVGMGRWQFDRLLQGCIPLCDKHTLIVQSGVSKVALPCVTKPFMAFDEVMGHLRNAQIIITHAGNTVRLVQKLGKVPIAMARESRFNEMGNDHQVRYLKLESESGLVVPVWNPKELVDLVEKHADAQAALLEKRAFPKPATQEEIAGCMNALCIKWIKRKAT
jgi:UDP-N-acetylglucosamine transferase subunit ALG13